MELVFSGLSEEDIRDYLSQDEEFVQEELALWDLTPSGPLDGSLCFFPGSVEAIAGIYRFLRVLRKLLDIPLPQQKWRKLGITPVPKELPQRRADI